MSKQKVNNCPYCGKKPKIINISSTNGKTHIYSVRCENCKRMIQLFETRKEAINAWNSMANKEVTVLHFNACPVCNHAPIISTIDLGDNKTAVMVFCPRCLDKTFIADKPQSAQLLWNSYADKDKSEVKE